MDLFRNLWKKRLVKTKNGRKLYIRLEKLREFIVSYFERV